MANTVELWCQNGEHKWQRESKRGRRPLHCPEHQPVVEPLAPGETGLDRSRRERRERADAEIWEFVKNAIKVSRCKCDLEPYMTRDDLDAIRPSWGCTDGRYICPALDTYRRLLPVRQPTAEELEFLEEVTLDAA